MIYYIDFDNGTKENSGTDENCPINYYRELELNRGDTVLFKRGTFIRDRLYNKDGISYGAYGEGENPTFCGSVNLSDPTVWEEREKNLWRPRVELKTEVCNIVFDGGSSYGTLRYSKKDLIADGDFFDSRGGCGEGNININDTEFFLYCSVNPALKYSDIECVLRVHRSLAEMGEDMTFSDLSFINNGVHAIAGLKPARNIHIKNCTFRNIGGSIWSKKDRIRFGNAVECWDVAENIVVEDCVFDNIYDSAVTHQGCNKCVPAVNFIIRNNVFKKCGMAAYEQRDLMPEYAEFSDNICSEAGEGFSKLGETMPRRSEIWPQPMGHHIFLWRIENPTENGIIKIENNKFGSSPYGEAIYSIISPDAEKQLKLSHNVFSGNTCSKKRGRDAVSFV